MHQAFVAVPPICVFVALYLRRKVLDLTIQAVDFFVGCSMRSFFDAAALSVVTIQSVSFMPRDCAAFTHIDLSNDLQRAWM